MADDIVLTAQARDQRGRTEVRKLRAEGLLPGVIYGSGIEAVALAVPRAELLRVLHAHGAHPLVTVKVEGGPRGGEAGAVTEYLALIKDLQIDAVKQTALHVDFHRVEANKPVQTEVEVVLVGTPEGVKTGGVLEQITRMVSIEALPRNLPEHIEFDVTSLELGSTVEVSALAAPAGVTILTDGGTTLATVVAPRVSEEVTLSAEEAEALAALSPEELDALKEYAAALKEAPAEGEAASAGEATEGDEGE
jgi:large subunit ribosomal protein L25